MNAKAWSTRLTWITDGIALLALGTTDEIQTEFWAIILAILVASLVVKAKLPVKWAFGVLASIVIAAVVAGIHYRFHPIVMAAYSAPLIHSITWLTPNSRRTRGWRMGFGFGELILASALTVEAYLIILIFGFIIIAAVSASCLFLEGELENSAMEVSQNPLPQGYISRSMGLACIIFLISLLIFPILPRMKIVSKGWDSLQTGYTEKVNLTEGAKINSNGESGTPLLWFFSRDKHDLSLEIPFGLIRGRSLDVFDGAGWSIGLTPVAHVQAPFNRKNSGPILVVDAIRAPSSFPSLPVPYGTFRVFSGAMEKNSFARHFEGDWVDPLTTRMQAHYTFAFEPQSLYLEGQTEMDRPRPIQLSVPKQLYTKRIKMLLSSLFKSKDTEKEKAQAIAEYFHNQSFYATLDSKPVDEINRNLNVARMHPLERFLFISKEGNCEWFATASAILLRMAGVPTRLVAGFRITKGPVAGVLSVRSSDAHAWVEYWSKNSGWTPFDPTPRVISPPSLGRFFADAYELLSNYWYRSILGYSTGDVDNGPETTANEPKLNQDNGVFAELRQWRQFFLTKMGVTSSLFLKLLFTMVALIGGTYAFLRRQYPWLFSIRHRFRMGNRELWKERLKMEKLIQSRAHSRVKEFHDVSEFKTILPHPLVMRWIELYLEIRFGRTELKAKQAIISLAQVRKELNTELQSA